MAPRSFQANRVPFPSSAVRRTKRLISFLHFEVECTFKRSGRAVDSTLSLFSPCELFIFGAFHWTRVNLLTTYDMYQKHVSKSIRFSSEIFSQRAFLRNYILK